MIEVDTGPDVRLETVGDVAVMTLDDPSALNSMTFDMVEGMLRALDAVSEPDSGVRALLITGEGRAFCAGLNVKRRDADAPDFPVAPIDTHFNPLIRRMRSVPVPIVMAVNGPAAGIGATFALTGDAIVASTTAYFLFPFVPNRGSTGDAGVTWLLPRMVGWPRARRMLLQAERVSAETACEWGLVEAVWDPSELREQAMELAQRLAGGPTRAMGSLRQALWTSMENGFEDQMRWEWDNVRELRKTEDSVEARQAFIEKRAPVFRGR